MPVAVEFECCLILRKEATLVSGRNERQLPGSESLRRIPMKNIRPINKSHILSSRFYQFICIVLLKAVSKLSRNDKYII